MSSHAQGRKKKEEKKSLYIILFRLYYIFASGLSLSRYYYYFKTKDGIGEESSSERQTRIAVRWGLHCLYVFVMKSIRFSASGPGTAATATEQSGKREEGGAGFFYLFADERGIRGAEEVAGDTTGKE